jgi:hypothetical protein
MRLKRQFLDTSPEPEAEKLLQQRFEDKARSGTQPEHI